MDERLNELINNRIDIFHMTSIDDGWVDVDALDVASVTTHQTLGNIFSISTAALCVKPLGQTVSCLKTSHLANGMNINSSKQSLD